MCFSLGWIEQLCVWAVIVVAVYTILKIVIPWFLGKLGSDGAMIVQILSVVMWAYIAIVCIWIVFALIACLISMGGGGFPLFPHRS